MGWFEELAKGVRLRGVAPSGLVTVIDADRLGSDVVNLTYEDGDGCVHRELVFSDGDVELVGGDDDRLWGFDADPGLFMLVAEAKRISLAYLFDPYLATHSSDVDLLPHQIEAVYCDMLAHSPLRFLLADDPRAGKTIMAGLLIKELIVRGDLERCLIVVPGGLAEQWQDELSEKFGLEFELFTREMVEATRSGDPFEARRRLIARLDMLARDEGLQAYLSRSDWDLVVVDEAHKMSATRRGGDVRPTKRYRLGRRLERVARHFLLMTATPHNGKPEDFQLFMALLDEDRFAGGFRRGENADSDEPPTDLMRRRVKEELLRFDGTKLFPEREAFTAKYPLSAGEADLYEAVTAYVREGMSRARQLRQEGEGRRSAVVGFALTVRQRRLASSPKAILCSLQRRRERLVRLLGRSEAVVAIHGGVRRGERRRVQDRFTQDESVRVLVATDAAGEGLNLQRAHLMVNYDLPWNPNRIEQRFGRIHRIGQTEVCRLWNLVADGTREGQVFERLLDKLEEQRRALGGKVFDVLGQAFSDRSLRDLLIDAITSDVPELQQLRMNEIIDTTVTDRVKALIEEHSLLAEELAPEAVAEIRDRMARARPWRLLPSFVRRFFLAAFELTGGRVTRHEGDRYQIRRVPPALRRWDADHDQGRLLERYERVCFERNRITVAGRPRADLLAPGHTLLDAVVAAVLDSHGCLLSQGAVLIDPTSENEQPSVLVLLEHEITTADTPPGRPRRPVSKRFEYVEITEAGGVGDPGTHPYLDCRIPDTDELELLKPLTTAGWVRDGLERTALRHAVRHNIPRHLAEVRSRVYRQVDRTLAAVEQRLTAERAYWDNQVLKLKDHEMAGKRNARLNSDQAAHRADEADERLRRRKRELASQRKLSALPSRLVGAAFIVPESLVTQLAGQAAPQTHPIDTARTERLAVDAVLAAERALGRDPEEMPHNHRGYDIETRDTQGDLVFMEVKGRIAGSADFTVTNSEVITGLNNAERHILTLVEITEDDATTVRYLYDPFTGRQSEPGYGEQKRILSWPDYWNLAAPPCGTSPPLRNTPQH